MASLGKTQPQKGKQQRNGLTSSSLLWFRPSHRWICSGCSYPRSVGPENRCSMSASWSRQEKVCDSPATASAPSPGQDKKLYQEPQFSQFHRLLPWTRGCEGHCTVTKKLFPTHKYP